MSAFKFWRVSNPLGSREYTGKTSYLASVGQLVFTNTEALPTSDPSKVKGYRMTSAEAAKAFDGSASTHAQVTVAYTSNPIFATIEYEFPSPVTVTSIGYAPRTGLALGHQEIWKRFLVEGSTDGITWEVQGQCFPTITNATAIQTLAIVPVVKENNRQHRYWRLTDVINRQSAPNVSVSWNVWEVAFYTVEGVLSLNPPNGFAPNWRLSESDPLLWHPSNAFTGHRENYDYNGYLSRGTGANASNTESWWLGYDFKYPVEVTMLNVQLSMERISNPAPYDWESVKVQYSDDGLVWEDAGFGAFYFAPSTDAYYIPFGVSFLLPVRDRSAVSKSLRLDSLTFRIPKNLKTIVARPYRPAAKKAPKLLGISTYPPYLSATRGAGVGYIAGTVYERVGDTSKKVPVAREVFLTHQKTAICLGSTWAGADGKYVFSGLDVYSEYMVTSIDHTGNWGLEGVAFKKPKELPLYELFI